MLMIHLRTFLFLFFLLPVSYLAGQEFSEKKFTSYTTADGLSDNTITGIAQDATGYVWLPSLSGLNRFDGARFIQYHSSNDSLSPASEEMKGLAWLDKERLAVFNVGLYIINTKTGERRNLFIPYHNKQYEYKFNMVAAARGDEQGNIFILSRSGFYHYDKNYNLVSRFDYYKESEVATEHFVFGRELLELDKRRMLIISVDGLYLYDKEKKQVKKMGATGHPLLTGFLNETTAFYRFFQQKPGCMVVAKMNTDSLWYIDIARNRKVISKAPFMLTEQVVHYRSKLVPVNDTLLYLVGHSSGFYKMELNTRSGVIKLFPEKYFGAQQCNALLTDRDNNLWVATSKGLFRQDDARAHVQFVNIPPSLENEFPGIQIDAVYATADKIYAGTRPRGGLLVFDKKTFQFEKQVIFKEYSSLNNASIYKISSPGPSTLLLGTGGPLFIYNEKTGKETKLAPPGWSEGDWTNDLYADSRGNTWISSKNIYRYDVQDKHFSIVPAVHSMPAIPVAIREDNTGNIWIAGHGIARYNTALNIFDIQLDSFPFIKMPDKQVTAMVIDKENNIWFSSANNGLTSYNIDKKKYRNFTRSNGLPDDNISSLIIVGTKLWIACYSGMACMDLQSLQIKGFGKEEGFPDMPVMKGSQFFYDNQQQLLYLGYHTAIARFNPNHVLSLKTPPSLFIESLKINGEKNIFLPREKITTSWQNNDIMITIGSINFSDGNDQRYAYRILKDIDSSWHQLGSQSSFSISGLAHGRHRIQVKIFSPANRWPEEVQEIIIEVLPPFWKQPWFGILVTVLLLGSFYLVVQWRTGVVRKKEMEKTHLQKLKAEEYKNQFELEQISNYFSSSLAGKKTENEVLWDVAGNLIGRMNYADCMIYLWNEEKTMMVQKAAYGPKGKPEYISLQVFNVLPGQGVVGHVIQTLQPVLIKDTRKDSRYRVDEAFRLSEICVPIIHNNELLGIIDSEHHQADYFTERDIKILTTIATLIGNKLKQLESEKTLEVKQQELAGINEQLAEAKLSALQAQMNPHFVFNALNSIKRMILEGENEKASRYLSKFAQMIRMTLNHSREAFISLQENAAYLKTYLEMEQLRFDGSFTWNISVAEDIDAEEIAIPSLMIQPLVENAIWHGLLPSAGEKKLSIEFKQKLDKISCTIEDNGIGFRRSVEGKLHQKTSHQSVGLDNLRKRIKILNEKFGAGCSLTIRELEDERAGGKGTRVVLEFTVINI